ARTEPSDEIRLLSERLRSMQENGGGSNPRVATAMANLADGISGLVKNMRSEQQIMRDWVEAQSDEQKAMRNTLEKIADALKKPGVH
ncbi:MAG: flagellar motor protein MotA, partial [Mesorhizobium sp.]